MAEKKEKVVEVTSSDVKTEKKTAKTSKKVAVDTSKKEEAKFGKPSVNDFDVVIEPIITEKSTTLGQTQNTFVFKVNPKANKAQIKIAFEKLYQVKVDDVRIVNVRAKSTTRGTRYLGTFPSYKKAIVKVNKDSNLDIFKE